MIRSETWLLRFREPCWESAFPQTRPEAAGLEHHQSKPSAVAVVEENHMNHQVTSKRMIASVVVIVIALALNLLVSCERAKAQGQVQITPADPSTQTSADRSGTNALLDRANRLSRAERW